MNHASCRVRLGAPRRHHVASRDGDGPGGLGRTHPAARAVRRSTRRRGVGARRDEAAALGGRPALAMCLACANRHVSPAMLQVQFGSSFARTSRPLLGGTPNAHHQRRDNNRRNVVVLGWHIIRETTIPRALAPCSDSRPSAGRCRGVTRVRRYAARRGGARRTRRVHDVAGHTTRPAGMRRRSEREVAGASIGGQRM